MKTETHELLLAAQKGDGLAFNELVIQNTALVKSVVKKYLGRGMEYDDLYQLGCMGLVKCIKKFDTTYDVEFSTYAVPMIAGEIRRFLRDDGMVRVSRSLKELAIKTDKARQEFINKNNREPTVNEIAEKTGVKSEDVVMALEALRPCVSIYEPLKNEKNDEFCVYDRIEDEKNNPEHMMDKLLLKEMLAKLSDDERKLILLRYFKDMTQSETARVLNISQVQVSRLESRIIKKLKNTY